MQEWLACRGYIPVPGSHVNILGFDVPQVEANPAQVGQLDYEVPYVLERRFSGTIAIRVVQTIDQNQLFVFVRNLTQAKFRKKDLFALFGEFLSKAPCIMISSRIPPQTSFGCLALAAKLKQNLELLLLSDIRYPK